MTLVTRHPADIAADQARVTTCLTHWRRVASRMTNTDPGYPDAHAAIDALLDELTVLGIEAAST